MFIYHQVMNDVIMWYRYQREIYYNYKANISCTGSRK